MIDLCDRTLCDGSGQVMAHHDPLPEQSDPEIERRGDFLQRWPVSKRVNNSKADADDATLIEPVEATVAASATQHH
jgi:hypothetical protein